MERSPFRSAAALEGALSRPLLSAHAREIDGWLRRRGSIPPFSPHSFWPPSCSFLFISPPVIPPFFGGALIPCVPRFRGDFGFLFCWPDRSRRRKEKAAASERRPELETGSTVTPVTFAPQPLHSSSRPEISVEDRSRRKEHFVASWVLSSPTCPRRKKANHFLSCFNRCFISRQPANCRSVSAERN